MKWSVLLIFLTFCSWSCKNTNSQQTPATELSVTDTVAQEEPKMPVRPTVYAWVDRLRLRESPDVKSKVMAEVAEGTALESLEERTDFTTEITLRGQVFNAPWLRVRTPDGIPAWVFSGAIRDFPPTPSPYDACERRRMEGKYEAASACQQKIQARELKNVSRQIEPTDTGYKVTLLSGETRNLVNESQIEAQLREYQYLTYYDKLGYFAFRINRYEGGEYILMNDKFGYVTPLQGYPRPSPDYEYVVTTNQDAESGYEYNGIQLFGFIDGGLQTIWEKEFGEFEPWMAQWIGKREIQFTLKSRPSAREVEMKSGRLFLGRDSTWQWEMF